MLRVTEVILARLLTARRLKCLLPAFSHFGGASTPSPKMPLGGSRVAGSLRLAGAGSISPFLPLVVFKRCHQQLIVDARKVLIGFAGTSFSLFYAIGG